MNLFRLKLKKTAESCEIWVCFRNLLVASALVVSSQNSHAHGEDVPGPNGGEVRMPGAFHTELKVKGREVQVYLLDVAFKNPTTASSSVEIQAIQSAGKKVTLMTCRPVATGGVPHFICAHPSVRLKAGDRLMVKARRGTSVGIAVEYKLPLLRADSSASSKKGDAPKGAKVPTSSHDLSHEESHGESHNESHNENHP